MKTGKEALIIIVSAPSGSGKTTIVDRLIGEVEGLERSISYTTRAPRDGEAEGKDYFFITSDEFLKKIDEGAFLEWEDNFGNYYGTARETVDRSIEKGRDVILSIDVKGAKKVKKMYPESVSVFIMPPSREELEARLKTRDTDEEEQVNLRLKESKKEIASSEEYDYLIVNEDLEKAVSDMKQVVATERNTRKIKK